MIASLLDTMLDRTVVAGYTSAGYRIRSRAWDADDLPSMDGKTVLVTGATSGLGLAAAEGFARLGARVRLLARSGERAERARAAVVEATGNRDVRACLCDMSDLRDVRAFAARFAADEPRLDVLVNNAGVLPAERALSADGDELTLATNVLGPFLLTNLLVGLLTESAPARVINVSSGGMYTQRLHVEDLQSTGEKFDGPTVYARTKRAQAILTELWARRLAGTGVVVHAMHPGWVDTPGVASSLPRFHRLDRTAPAQPRTGSGHDRLARRRCRAGRQLWRLLARPQTAPDAPRAVDEGGAGGSRAALARVRAPHRLARSPGAESDSYARIEERCVDSACPAPNDRATPPPRTFADEQTTRLTAALQRSSDDARTAQAGARYAG